MNEKINREFEQWKTMVNIIQFIQSIVLLLLVVCVLIIYFKL